MAFSLAGPAEMLRSSQKDESVIKNLERSLENLLLGFGGPRISMKYKYILKYLTHLLYYSNTTLCTLQTLGEEYTGIVQVDGSLRKLPSFMNRLIMILLDCFGVAISTSFLSLLEHIVKENNDLVPDAKIKLINVLYILKKIIPFINHIHKAYFYCNWSTYHLAKRFTGINYILVRFWLKDRKSLYGFKILGIITFLNLIILGINSSKDFISSDRSSTNNLVEIQSDSNQNCDKICPMCLSNLNSPACTPCGHIFCWNCILEWLNNDEKCPLCRDIVQPSRVVQLMNYC